MRLEKFLEVERPARMYRQFLVVASLVAALLFGSSSLISAVADLQASTRAFARVSPAATTSPVFEGKPRLNYSLVRDSTFTPTYHQLQWIQEPTSIDNDKGTYLLKNNDEYVVKSIVDDAYSLPLFNGTSFEYDKAEYEIEALVASPNLRRAVLKTNSTQNWRWSSFALYWVLDVATNSIEPLGGVGEKISTFKWSPTSAEIAYIFNNNVFIRSLEDGSISQVTSDGDANIFNGKPDWVYEEEVFSSDIALWWSPLGDRVAFLKTNDTLVPEYSIPYFVQDKPQYADYPEFRDIKYPKAGYPNPVAKLVVHTVGGALAPVAIAADLITEVVWVSRWQILVKTSNRASDLLEVYLVDAQSLDVSLVRSYTAQQSWFEVSSNAIHVPRNETQGRHYDGYIDTVVVDGYNHLAYFSPPSNSTPVVLTRGQWEVVDDVVALDHTTNEVYFMATKKSAIERHFYSVNLLNALGVHNVTDVSSVGWYSGLVLSGLRFLLLNYRGPSTPHQRLVDLHTGKTIKTLEDNAKLAREAAKYAIPESRYQVVNVAGESEDEVLAHAIETLPLGFDEKKRYPLLFFVYGGPGSQTVNTAYQVSFSQAVALELDAVVVTVDGRGTGFNNLNAKLGSNFKFCVRDQLGYYEPRDQISAARLWSARSYIDSSRIAIWGWSYGGFLTLKTLELDSQHHVFLYGMAVAPVTKWRLYDSIYTERYMRTPQENPLGYETASIHNLTNFANVQRFLVAHGSGDDNVHFQNSLKLIDEFNLARIENFDFYVFPDSDHAIRYHNGNVVVYDRLMNWLRSAFTGQF
jgi:dipeptidyl aminopeptidase